MGKWLSFLTYLLHFTFVGWSWPAIDYDYKCDAADAGIIRMVRYNGSTRLFLSISRLFNSNVTVGKSKHTTLFIEYFTIFSELILKVGFVCCLTLTSLSEIFILHLVIYHSDLPVCLFIQIELFIILYKTLFQIRLSKWGIIWRWNIWKSAYRVLSLPVNNTFLQVE